jgi:tetratricopeptide (TPR) repeat protein
LPAYRIDAAVMMAACHQAEGQPRQAIRQLQECLGWLDDSDPKWLKVAHELAALYAEVGDQEQALAQVQRVLDVDAGYEPATALLERLKESPAMKEKEHERANAKPPKAAEPPPPAAGPRTDKTKRHRISYV